MRQLRYWTVLLSVIFASPVFANSSATAKGVLAMKDTSMAARNCGRQKGKVAKTQNSDQKKKSVAADGRG